MKLAHTLRESTKVFDVKGIPQYKVAQNPSDKKWYVLGVTGKYLMPMSDGKKSRKEAEKWAMSQVKIDRKEKGWM